MRRFYFFLGLLFITSLAIFIASFFYLEKEKHAEYNFIISLDGRDIGFIKADKYATEDKLIYKSVQQTPFLPLYTESKSRETFDRFFNLDTYVKEDNNARASKKVFLQKVLDGMSFVGVQGPEFLCLEKFPVKNSTFAFDDESPVTFLPLIDNYNFKRGRSQGFNIVTNFSPLLAPMKRFIIFTSIRDEYLDIEKKLIKTECLVFRMRNFPQGTIWVAKSDKSLIMLELPNKRLKIRRTFVEYKPMVKERAPKESPWHMQVDEIFKNKNIKLSGTLALPKKETKHPGVILVGGDGPEDRNALGVFRSLRYALAEAGCAVFTYDKRGTGLSDGDYKSVTEAEDIEDLNAAIDFLKARVEIDPQNLFLIGYSKGAILISKIVNVRSDIRSIIMMAPFISYTALDNPNSLGIFNLISARYGWTENYAKNVKRAFVETKQVVKDSKESLITLLGNACFVGRMKEIFSSDPFEAVKNVKIPILILYGMNDQYVPVDLISGLDKMLKESANNDCSTVYFSYLDHYFGPMDNDGIHRIRYEVAEEVSSNIARWIERIIAALAPPQESTAAST